MISSIPLRGKGLLKKKHIHYRVKQVAIDPQRAHRSGDFFDELDEEDLATLFPQRELLSPFQEKRKRLSLSRLFSTPTQLKKALVLSPLLPLYSAVVPEKGDLLLLLTFAYWDGLGDFTAQMEIATIIQKQFPDLTISLITLVKEGIHPPPFPTTFSHTYLSYRVDTKQQILYQPFPPPLLALMKQAFLILQFPTFYLHTEKVKAALSHLYPNSSLPAFEVIEEGGFYPRRQVDPEIKVHAMGLHFFEKGLLMKNSLSPLQVVPQAFTPPPSELPFHLAYTYSARGMSLFLHSLFRFKEEEEEEIQILFFEMEHLLHALQHHFLIEKKEESLLARLSIHKIEMYLEEHKKVELLCAKRGKVVRFFHKKRVEHGEFLRLLSLSSPWLACRGEQSLIEALSIKKLFFYDLPPHKERMLSDLIVLIREQCTGASTLVELLELFSSKEDLSLLGNKIATLLHNPKLTQEIAELSSFLSAKHDIRTFLFHTISRALSHHRDPQLKKREEEHLYSFYNQTTSLKNTLKKISFEIDWRAKGR